MSAEEFVEWAAFYQLEPWGYDVQNWRMGVLGATVANYAGRTRKRPDAKPSDFVPRDRRPRRRQQTPEEMKQALRGIARPVNENPDGDRES